jgi:hypothetical protein
MAADKFGARMIFNIAAQQQTGLEIGTRMSWPTIHLTSSLSYQQLPSPLGLLFEQVRQSL